MEEITKLVLNQAFKDYYFRRAEDVEIPDNIANREFGYSTFENAMVRHLSFSSAGEFHAFLVKESPYSVFSSVSCYAKPSLPMEEKGWQGADLVFDIDVKDLEMPCRRVHDSWHCRECGKMGSGLRPAICPSCKTNRINVLGWGCQTCLAAAKDHVHRIIDFLLNDFGTRADAISVFFSGNLGYHVEVRGQEMDGLDHDSRIEIADYITGVGITPQLLGVFPRDKSEVVSQKMPLTSEAGWRGRLARHFSNKLKATDAKSDAERAMAIQLASLGYRRFTNRLAQYAMDLGAKIDRNVTLDLHRIFRMGGTLHNKSGLIKKRCEDLTSFDPFNDALGVIGEPIEVHVSYSPPFTLGDEDFGPYSDSRVTLPLHAAAYLMCKGLARPRNDS